MLRLLDARSGAPAVVRPARPGLLRVCAHAPAGAGPADLTELRVLLVADLLARTAELGNLQVLTALAAEGPSTGPAAAFERAAAALGIRPPAGRVDRPADAPAALGGPIDVHLAGATETSGTAGPGGRDSPGGLVVPVGAAGIARSAGDGAAALACPAATRLALLSVPYHQPVSLAERTLEGAAETVRRWRRQVAGWAESPSRPIPPDRLAAVRAAFSDLDTVQLLTLLHGLAGEPGVPAGAKFETFLYADRILALDLPSGIGTACD